MSKHITIIDKIVGTSKYGFCVRVGKEQPMVRLAGCIGYKRAVGWENAVYKTFDEAYSAAINFRNNEHPDYSVRADCTLDE